MANDSHLASFIDIYTTGTVEAVAKLQSVSDSTRRAGRDIEDTGEKWGKASKVIGKLGGADRTSFMAVMGIQEAIDGANGSWKKFGSSLAQTGLYAGAAIAIGAIVSKAKELSHETDELYKKMGKEPPGFWKNLGAGYGEMKDRYFGGGVKGETAAAIPITQGQRDDVRRQLAEKTLKEYKKEKTDEEQAIDIAVNEGRMKEVGQILEGIKEKKRADKEILDAQEKYAKALNDGVNDEMKRRDANAKKLAGWRVSDMTKREDAWRDDRNAPHFAGLDTQGSTAAFQSLNRWRSEQENPREIQTVEEKQLREQQLMREALENIKRNTDDQQTVMTM